MNEDNVKIFDQLGEKKVLEVLKEALTNGVSYGLDKSFDVVNIAIRDNSILVYYSSETHNSLVIYNDFASIIGFIHGFLVNDFKTQRIFNIGVHSQHKGETEIYILSPIESAKAISEGNAVYWLKNSICNEQIHFPKEKYLLVEGESELVAFPVLFKSINIDINIHKINLYPYSKHNLKTILSILNHKNDSFYLVSDNDKEKEIVDLKREGLLTTNFHILHNGELEDYIDPEALIKILKSLTPQITITPKYIEKNRTRGLGTSKIVAKYYHQESLTNQNPAKPVVAEKIAHHWAKHGVPSEFVIIMNEVLNCN